MKPLAHILPNQPIVRVALALMLGIVTGFASCAPQWLWMALAAISLCMAAVVRGKLMWKGIALLACAYLVGCALANKASHDAAYPFVEDTPMVYDAVIVAEPQVKGKTLACDIVITAVNGQKTDDHISVKATILRDTASNLWQHLHTGSCITARSVMQPLENFHADSHFDYARWLQCHGFRARTFIFYHDWYERSVSDSDLTRMERMRVTALRLRQGLVAQLMPDADKEDGQDAAVVAAMVLGDKHSLDKKTKDMYSVTGAAHILALSGLHLGVIYGVLMMLFGGGIRRRWLSQSVIVAAIWIFVILVGMGASVVRSATMLTVYSVCVVAARDRASISALAIAAIAMLVISPMSLWDIGFQLSFMSVLAIVVLYGPLYKLMPATVTQVPVAGRVAGYLWGATVVSLVAQVGTAPLVAYYFGRFPCYFLLSNYIVVPCASVIIYGALAVLFTVPLPMVNAFLAKALAQVAVFLNDSVVWVASLPWASVETSISAMQAMMFYAVIVAVYAVASYIHNVRVMARISDETNV